MVIPDANTAAGPLMVKLHWMDGTFMPDASHAPPMVMWHNQGPAGHPGVAVTVTMLPAGTLHTPGAQAPPGKEAVSAPIIGPWVSVSG